MFFGRCYMFYRFSTLPCGFFSFKLAQLCMCLPYWYDVRFAFCDIRAWIKVNTRYELSNHWLRLFRQFDVIFFALYAYVLRVCTPSIIQSRACFHVLILSVSMLLIGESAMHDQLHVCTQCMYSMLTRIMRDRCHACRYSLLQMLWRSRGTYMYIVLGGDVKVIRLLSIQISEWLS